MTVIVHIATLAVPSSVVRNAVRSGVYAVMLTVMLLLPSTNAGSVDINMTIDLSSQYMIRHFVYNILLFVPLGYYLCLTIKKKYFILLLPLYIVAVELLQIVVAGRVCDINDIIANTLGVLVGATIAIVVQRIINRRNNDLQDNRGM